MRSRVPLFALLLVVGSLALPFAAHAGIPFFGPIIDKSWVVQGTATQCALGWGAVMTVVNNIISLLLTLAIVFVAPIMIAYAGFIMVTGQGNPSEIGKAKGILLNTIIGIVIALAGYLIVAAVMAVLYNPSATSGTTTLGVWSSLITSNGALPCLDQNGVGTGLNQAAPTGVTVTAGGSVTPLGKTAAQCSSSNTACSPAALQAVGLTATQANVMSCLAVTESSGNPSTPPYNTTHPGSNSTACGTFQITQTTWNGAASGACSDFSNCQNAVCNMQVAQRLVSTVGYTPWTCANCNSKASSCVQQYGGS